MISYTKRFVNVISLLITILIYFFVTNVSINFCPQSIFNMFKKSVVQVELNSNSVNLNSDNGIEEKIEIQNDYPKNQIVTNEVIEDTKEVNWKILIPAIALEAEISEGTSKEIMDKYVGHFEETSKSVGNVGLAAHNRGYNVNYFANLKKLKEGDTAIVYLPGHYGTIVDYNAKKDKYLLMDPHYLPKRGTSSFGDWVSQKDLEEGALMVQTFFYYKAE